MKIINHNILDFQNIIFCKAEISIIDTLYEQNYNDIKLKSPYFKKIFFNSLSKEIISFLKNNKEPYYFIILPPKPSELSSYFDNFEEYSESYIKNIQKFINLYPINAKIYNNLNSNDEEFTEIIISDLKNVKTRNEKKTFSKIKSFIKTYDLIYLDKQIFSSHKSRYMFS